MSGAAGTNPRELVRRRIIGAPGLDMWVTHIGRFDWPTLVFHGPRVLLAWALRRAADRLDGTVSYTYGGTLPRGCTNADRAYCFRS